jgi:DnaJ family protein C protein 28
MNVEDQIRRAMQEGHFDNLPGKGKPLKLEENPCEDPEKQMAHKILKDAGYSLPWIENGREIHEGLEVARADLKRAWIWRREGLARNELYAQVEAEWQRAEMLFRQRVAALNKRIFTYNLEVPSPQFQRLVVDVERDIEAIKKEASETPFL